MFMFNFLFHSFSILVVLIDIFQYKLVTASQILSVYLCSFYGSNVETNEILKIKTGARE